MECIYKKKVQRSVSRETFAQITQYVQQLLLWNQKIHLIANNLSEDEIYMHILDAIFISEIIQEKEKVSFVDLGSGNGILGVVLSILGYQCYLVEKNIKKAVFLMELSLRLNLSLQVIQKNIQDLRLIDIENNSKRKEEQKEYTTNTKKNQNNMQKISDNNNVQRNNKYNHNKITENTDSTESADSASVGRAEKANSASAGGAEKADSTEDKRSELNTKNSENILNKENLNKENAEKANSLAPNKLNEENALNKPSKETKHIVITKALASLHKILNISSNIISKETSCFICKSPQKISSEIKEAKGVWTFNNKMYYNPYNKFCIVLKLWNVRKS